MKTVLSWQNMGNSYMNQNDQQKNKQYKKISVIEEKDM